MADSDTMQAFGFMRARAPIKRLVEAKSDFLCGTALNLRKGRSANSFSLTWTPISEPDRSFIMAWQKIRWAEQQVREVIRLCNNIIANHPRAIVIERDPNGVWALAVKPLRPIPIEIAMIVGDATHNLKSALDYCWMGLHRSLNPSPKKDTMPRGDTWKEVKGVVKKAAEQLNIPGIVEFIPDVVQPYRQSSTDEDGKTALWLLGKIDNWNKHNLPVVTVVANRIKRAKVVSSDGANVRLEDIGARGAFNLFGFGRADWVKFEGKPDITIEIIVGTGKSREEGNVAPFLMSALQQTAEVVQMFYATFAKNPFRKLI